jgi:hypothetical protein
MPQGKTSNSASKSALTPNFEGIRQMMERGQYPISLLNETPAKPSQGRSFPRHQGAKGIFNETTTGGLPRLQDPGGPAALVSDPKRNRGGAGLEN